MKTISLLTITSMIVFLTGCCPDNKNKNALSGISEKAFTSGQFEVIADTITYDVIIKNPVKEDAWTESCLKHLKRDRLIDVILEKVKEGTLTAYDYETLRPLSWMQIDSMKEANNNKMVVGKIQFKELWAFDKDSMRMYKKVHSAIFGYETYNDDGEVRSYKALFRINFK